MSDDKDKDKAFLAAVKNIKWNDFSHLAEKPCVRTSLLYGIGTGTGVGLVRFLTSRLPLSSCNWAVGAFCGVSVLSYEYCQQKRAMEVLRLRNALGELNSRNKGNGLSEQDVRDAQRVAGLNHPGRLHVVVEKEDEGQVGAKR
ncbi:hypothetical protein BZG36_03977 [Bifiguratus adelaidae]|uniref:Cytochrome c oxidase assembly protein COX20, mitochondrial n=1 Tax=Bifiguratus adelaidae TaxID=1938954 RepID=A0A261XXF5_9FUNG|nr:hypothetical protein BZG36_03977 [Bifiguratus adelaidae]